MARRQTAPAFSTTRPTPTVSGNPLFPDYGNSYGIRIINEASANTLGGLTAQVGTGAGNLVAGNQNDVVIDGGSSNTIEGNQVGLLSTGLPASDFVGIDVFDSASLNLVGGLQAAGSSNLISGTNFGVLIGTTSFDNTVEGDVIGTAVAGGIGNVDGVSFFAGAHNNTIGGSALLDRNIISGNSKDGVLINGVRRRDEEESH